jgi:uncharacterized repeat protein (TIGR01451 family)
VVAISGCTGNNNGISTGPGVQIVSWTPSLSTVDSGDQLEFRLQVQNKGDVPAQDVNAVVMGILPEDWHLETQEGSVTNAGDGQFFHADELLGPDKSQNIDSSPTEVTISAIAPSLSRGQILQYNPQVRVFYTYDTSASTLLTVVNDQELKRLQDQGKTLATGTTTQSTGPLTVTINTGKFLKAKTISGSPISRTFQITVNIQNSGGGVLSPNLLGSGIPNENTLQSDDYKADFAIGTTSNRLTLDCPSLKNDISIMLQIPSELLNVKSGVIKFFQGKSSSVTCTVTINNVPLSQEQDEIKVLLDYDYYIDSSTTITVNGQD